MSTIYYCPGCGNVTVCGVIEIFGSSFEEQEKITATVKRMISDVKIPLEEQKLCFICEERIKRNSKKKIISGISGTSVVNSCVGCFDLQINGVWQRFTHKQKENLRKAFLSGSLYFDGEAISDCPSCVVTIIYCTKCKRAKVAINNGKWETPLKAVLRALDQKSKEIKHADAVCEDCKVEDLCKTGPIAVCTER